MILHAFVVEAVRVEVTKKPPLGDNDGLYALLIAWMSPAIGQILFVES